MKKLSSIFARYKLLHGSLDVKSNQEILIDKGTRGDGLYGIYYYEKPFGDKSVTICLDGDNIALKDVFDIYDKGMDVVKLELINNTGNLDLRGVVWEVKPTISLVKANKIYAGTLPIFDCIIRNTQSELYLPDTSDISFDKDCVISKELKIGTNMSSNLKRLSTKDLHKTEIESKTLLQLLNGSFFNLREVDLTGCNTINATRGRKISVLPYAPVTFSSKLRKVYVTKELENAVIELLYWSNEGVFMHSHDYVISELFISNRFMKNEDGNYIVSYALPCADECKNNIDISKFSYSDAESDRVRASIIKNVHEGALRLSKKLRRNGIVKIERDSVKKEDIEIILV